MWLCSPIPEAKGKYAKYTFVVVVASVLDKIGHIVHESKMTVQRLGMCVLHTRICYELFVVNGFGCLCLLKLRFSISAFIVFVFVFR